MFGRLKAAVDARIQEEIARAQNPSSLAPTTSSTGTVRSRSATRRDTDRDGDDLTLFDSDLSGTGTPARSGTPAQDEEGKALRDGGSSNGIPGDLPTEVRAKLRKLEKLEKRYLGGCISSPR